jgi:hypothetical protein
MNLTLTESAAATLAQLCDAHKTPAYSVQNALYKFTRDQIGNTDTEAQLATVWALITPLLPLFSDVGQYQLEALAASHLCGIRRQAAREKAPLIPPSLLQKGEKYGKVDI